MILNFMDYRDRKSAQQKVFVKRAYKLGYRHVSISIYGDPADPFYAGVMVLRDVATEQKARWDMSLSRLGEVCTWMLDFELVPSFISATGSAADPRFAVIFEPHPPGVIPQMSFEMDQKNFEEENAKAVARGDILRSAAVYGASTSERRYAAVWWPNRSKVLWRVFTEDDPDSMQQKAAAMRSQWGRPVFIVRSTDGRYLSMYRDDSIGKVEASGELTSERYELLYDTLIPQGYFPLYVQAVGTSASEKRFSAIFARGEDVLPRRFTVTGTSKPKLKPFDDLMEFVLKKGGGRAAALAIAHKGQVIHSRAYTWADSTYPVTQPKSLFGTASVSKALTAIATHQLFEQGALPAAGETFVQPILKLQPPLNMKFSGTDPATNTSWVDKIKVKHLLAQASGLRHGGPPIQSVAAAFGHPQNIVLTKREFISHALCDMKFPPGSAKQYSNTGYLLLGMVIEAVTGLPYEQAMQKLLFKPLDINTARVGKALIEDRAPDEVFYHTNVFDVAKSQVTNDQPYVATQYGAGGDVFVQNDASGGIIISAHDCARILAAFEQKPAAPIFKKTETSDALWDCGVWEGVVPYQNGKDEKGEDVLTRSKGGGMGGITALIFRRDDGYSAVAFLAHNVWPADAEMSLSGVPEPWAVFQLNEHLNMLNGVSPNTAPIVRDWLLNCDGFISELFIEGIDEDDNFVGKIVNSAGENRVGGIWHEAERKLVFSREVNASDPSTLQVFTGYLMEGNSLMAGTFEAFGGSNATAGRRIFGWTASLL